MEIEISTLTSKRKYQVAEIPLYEFSSNLPIKKIILYPVSYSVLSLLKKARVIRYNEGKIRGFLISAQEKIYWMKIEIVGPVLKIAISRISKKGEEEWTNSETISIPSEEEKKELWVPIDEHFLFSGTPWLE